MGADRAGWQIIEAEVEPSVNPKPCPEEHLDGPHPTCAKAVKPTKKAESLAKIRPFMIAR